MRQLARFVFVQAMLVAACPAVANDKPMLDRVGGGHGAGNILFFWGRIELDRK